MALFGPGLDTQGEQQRLQPITTWETTLRRFRLTMTLQRFHMNGYWMCSGRAITRARGPGHGSIRRQYFITTKDSRGWPWKAETGWRLRTRGRFTPRSFPIQPFTWLRIIIKSIRCSSAKICGESSRPSIRTQWIW